MTSCRPRCRSVRSLRSAMPFSFLAWTRSLIRAIDLLRADPVRQLGDHDPGAPRGELLDPGRGPGAEHAAAGLVGLPDPVQADDLAAGGQVGPGHEPHQLVQVRVRVGDQVPGGRHDLAEVVRGHVGGHPDGDPGRAVDQQVRDRGREHLGLGLGAVVVRDEVDRVLVERVWSSPWPRRPAGPRCSASPPAGRRRPASRSCRARRSAAAASPTAGPSGPARRRWPRRRAGAAAP